MQPLRLFHDLIVQILQEDHRRLLLNTKISMLDRNYYSIIVVFKLTKINIALIIWIAYYFICCPDFKKYCNNLFHKTLV